MPCHGTAANSHFDGDDNATVRPNEAVAFVLHAKNRSGELVQEGTDMVRAEWFDIHNHGASLPPIEVLSKPGGRYEITLTPPTLGEYSVEVFINDEKVPHTLSIQCTGPWFHFDESECQPGLVISQDKLTVTKCGDHMFPSVLGSSGRAHGKHIWKVKIGQKAGLAIGVAEKPGLTAARSNFKQAYFWSTLRGGEFYVKGIKSYVGKVEWSSGDVIHFLLDCEEHALEVSNPRTAQVARIRDLPAAELFPYFHVSRRQASVSLVW